MSIKATEIKSVSTPKPSLQVRRVDALASLHWIRQGLNDFNRIPSLSILYGVLFAGLCAGAYALSRSVPWYTLGYLTGLVAVGPFLAAGLYVAGRDLSEGRKPSIAGGFRLLNQRKTYLALFSLVLTLIMAGWIRLSALIFALKFNTLSPSVEAYTGLLASADGWMTLAYFGGIGFLLVTIVFTFSAVAIPLIVDRDENFISAMQASYRAVTSNPAAMVVWAALIVSMTAIGLATAFIGLAIIFPILGYATWHSYLSLVK